MGDAISDAIYESDLGDDREFARAIRVCLMGTTAFPPLTFSPTGASGSTSDFLAAWKDWHREVFEECLAPQLVRCYQAIQQNKVDEVLQSDRLLDEALREVCGSSLPVERSAAAGSAFYGTVEGARHLRQMDRFREAVMNQQIPGHFATVLAVEAALFHVPLMHLLPACLFAEWRGASGAFASERTSRVGDFLSAAEDEIKASRKTVQASLGQSGHLVVCA